jgi:selT/selW/selH-like putative selenoprotein
MNKRPGAASKRLEPEGAGLPLSPFDPRQERSMLSTNPTLDRQSSPAAAQSLERPQASVCVHYCAPGNHERIARALAAEIAEEFGIACELIPSRGGVFEVLINGRLVFSKKATCRFPESDEIFYHIRNR